jgi:arylsulfatase A-like enzyme
MDSERNITPKILYPVLTGLFISILVCLINVLAGGWFYRNLFTLFSFHADFVPFTLLLLGGGILLGLVSYIFLYHWRNTSPAGAPEGLVSFTLWLYIFMFFLLVGGKYIDRNVIVHLPQEIMVKYITRILFFINFGILSTLCSIVIYFLFRFISDKISPPRNRSHIALVSLGAIISILAVFLINDIRIQRTTAETRPKIAPDQSYTTKPVNVLFIIVDTLRADFLGCYGNSEISTPAIDRLAGEGILFPNAFCQSNQTSPSHASIFCSRYVKSHGVWNNKMGVDDSLPLLTEYIRAYGYKTAAFTSVFFLDHEHCRIARGFSHFAAPSHPERNAEATNQLVFEWLEKNHTDPFFVWVHYFDPHTPYEPPPPFDSMYYRGDPRDPDNHDFERIPSFSSHLNIYRGITDLTYFEKMYMGEVSYVDRSIGNLLRKLEDLQIDSRTLVIVTSDHGENLGEHSLFYNHQSLYDQVIRVPLIFSFPSKSFSGTVCDGIVQSIDILPTVCDYLEIPLPDSVQGFSLMPLIKGEAADLNAYAFSESRNGWAAAVQDLDWKLMMPVKGTYYPNHRFELYSISDDPSESRNMYFENARLAKEYETRLKEWRKRDTFQPEGTPPSVSLKDLDRLKALGYIH